MKRTIVLGAVALTGLLALAGSAAAQTTTTPAPPPPPSVVEICAATSIAQVDQILTRVATSDLVGQLRPLVGITVPKPTGGIQVDAGTSLNALKTTLVCQGAVVTTTPAAPTTTPAPTTTMAPPATTTVRPTTTPAADDNGVTTIPIGGVQTGYGPGA